MPCNDMPESLCGSFLEFVCSVQGGANTPSAPPLHPHSDPSGPVRYPDVYKPSEAAAEAKTNKDFWGQQLGEPDKEQGRNQGFWGDALGGPASTSQAPKKDTPWEEANKEAARYLHPSYGPPSPGPESPHLLLASQSPHHTNASGAPYLPICSEGPSAKHIEHQSAGQVWFDCTTYTGTRTSGTRS